MEHLNNIELRSEEVQEILSSPPGWIITWGTTVLATMVFLTFIGTFIIKYPDHINSDAVITTDLPPQKEYASITANIDTFLVENLEVVDSEIPVIVLESSGNYRDILHLKALIDSAFITLDSAYFPSSSSRVLSLGTIQPHFADFQNDFLEYRLNQDHNPLQQEVLSNKHSLDMVKLQLTNLERQKKLRREELELKQKELRRSKLLFSKGVISAQNLEQEQAQYISLLRSSQGIEMEYSEMKKRLNDAEFSKYNSQVHKEKMEKVLLQNLFQSFNQLKRSIRDWERVYVLKTKIKGKVSFMNYWNQNQSLNAGDLAFTVVPVDFTNYIAKLKTPTFNSGKIKVGQSVLISLDNYPPREFGKIEGRIKTISLLPTRDGNYIVDVALPRNLITTYNNEIVFKPEMHGSAKIITEDLRLIERIFHQVKDLFK